MALNPILLIILWTLVPALELRASIPIGIIGYNIAWPIVFLVAVAANIILAPIVYFFLDKVVHIFLRIKWINKIYSKHIERTQKRIRPYVEKYGHYGLALFIGVPLPGSGVYTGMFAAYLLGIGYKKSFLAAIIGVLIAGIIVTLISVTGAEAWSFFIKY